MEIQMYSKSGEPNGTTHAYSVSKPGQHYTIYGHAKENVSEISAYMKRMLTDKDNPDLQDYARRVLNMDLRKN